MASSTACVLPGHQRTHLLDRVLLCDSAERSDACTEKTCLLMSIVPKCMRFVFKKVPCVFVAVITVSLLPWLGGQWRRDGLGTANTAGGAERLQ